jgi:lipoprotein-anchoring transpeptidase ErfK/SrfK
VLVAVTITWGATEPSWAQPASDGGGANGSSASKHANPAVYAQARSYRGTKIMISTKDRMLRLVAGRDTLLSAPVGVGMGTNFEYDGKTFRFETPTGRRTVRSKSEKPIWTPPEWHYMEKAASRGLELVKMSSTDVVQLGDGTHLLIIDNQVGRVNQFGNFWPITPGTEIIFDKKLFMPPMGTAQRLVPDALGPYKLDMGEGYLIHGTHIYNEDSVGGAVSHGCIRMRNEDLEMLYHLVKPGVPVFIY